METTDRLDRLIPWMMVLTVLAVAVFAFVQSYTHVFTLGQTHHQNGASLRMLPLSVDWLMFAAALVRLHLKRKDLKHWLPPAGLALGAIATLIANVASGIIWGWETAAISAWAPIVLFVVVELGMLLVRTAKAKTAQPEYVKALEERLGEFRFALSERDLAEAERLVSMMQGQTTKLSQPQPAPDPGPETASMPVVPEAVTGSPGDTLQGWGQLGRQEPAKPGLNGIGLRNGGQ